MRRPATKLTDIGRHGNRSISWRVPRRVMKAPMPATAISLPLLDAVAISWTSSPRAAPDAVPQLKRAGMKLVENVTPHVWNYHLSVLPGSPWTDVRLALGSIAATTVRAPAAEAVIEAES